MFKSLVNKLKMINKKDDAQNPGNVYIPKEQEVIERKEDVDDNKK